MANSSVIYRSIVSQACHCLLMLILILQLVAVPPSHARPIPGAPVPVHKLFYCVEGAASDLGDYLASAANDAVRGAKVYVRDVGHGVVALSTDVASLGRGVYREAGKMADAGYQNISEHIELTKEGLRKEIHNISTTVKNVDYEGIVGNIEMAVEEALLEMSLYFKGL